MGNRTEELIAQLEAEIAERDARIAELEEESMQDTKVINDLLASIHELKSQQPSAGVVDDRAAFDEWFNDFSLSVRMNGGQMNDAQMFAAWQARARLDQPTASASVVVGALVSALEGIVHDERVPNEVSQDYAALLIEARRLNPCRAQAVPDGWREVIQKTLRNYRMGTLSDGEGGGYPLIDAMSADGQTVAGGIEECEYLAEAIWCALNEAAAPSANSEQARSCVTCNGVGIIGHSTLCPECAAAPSANKESGDE